MSPDVLGWIGGGAVALLAAVWTTLTSRRTNNAKAKLDDISAYSTMVADLRTEVDRLREELVELRALLATAQTDNGRLRAQIAALQRTVDRLTRLLTEHKIPLPADA